MHFKIHKNDCVRTKNRHARLLLLSDETGRSKHDDDKAESEIHVGKCVSDRGPRFANHIHVQDIAPVQSKRS